MDESISKTFQSFVNGTGTREQVLLRTMDRIVDYADIDLTFVLEVSSKPGPLQIKGSGTLYDVIGSVKRHEELASCAARFSLHLKESFLFPSLRPRLAA